MTTPTSTPPVINLHTIFQHLVSDNKFLSKTKIDVVQVEPKPSIPTVSITKNSDSDTNTLIPGDVESWTQLNPTIRMLLSNTKYKRHGIRVQPNEKGKAKSFILSLAICLIPSLLNTDIETQTLNMTSLETFLVHRIKCNYQIDKIKNTRKVQEANNQIVYHLKSLMITNEVLNVIVNIFEVNLVIFDLAEKTRVRVHWARGIRHQTFNPHRQLLCMTRIGESYEPLITQTPLAVEDLQQIYSRILCLENIGLKLDLQTLYYISTWPIKFNLLVHIITRYTDNAYYTNNFSTVTKIFSAQQKQTLVKNKRSAAKQKAQTKATAKNATKHAVVPVDKKPKVLAKPKPKPKMLAKPKPKPKAK